MLAATRCECSLARVSFAVYAVQSTDSRGLTGTGFSVTLGHVAKTAGSTSVGVVPGEAGEWHPARVAAMSPQASEPMCAVIRPWRPMPLVSMPYLTRSSGGAQDEL